MTELKAGHNMGAFSDWLDSYLSWISGEYSAEYLIELYGLDCSTSRLAKNLPSFTIDMLDPHISLIGCYDEVCPHCGNQYTASFPTKSQITRFAGKSLSELSEVKEDYRKILESLWTFNVENLVKCPSCHHIPKYDDCNCDACKSDKLVQVRRHEKMMREAILEQYEPQGFIELSDLSFKHKLYLYCLVRGWGDHELQVLNPFNSETHLLTPLYDKSISIFRELYHEAHAIAPDPSSDLSAFSFKDHDTGYVFYINRVRWLIRVHDQGEVLSFDDLYVTLSKDLQLSHNTEPVSVLSVWNDLVRQESVQWLVYWSDSYSLRLDENKQVPAIIDTMIDAFSIAQIYYMIYKTAKDVAAFYNSDECHGRPHAINTFSGRLRNYVERAITEGWEVTKFSRDRRVGRSILSEVLLDAVLQLDIDAGFRTTPNEWYQGFQARLIQHGDTSLSPHCPSCRSSNVDYKQSDHQVTILCDDCDAPSFVFRLTDRL